MVIPAIGSFCEEKERLVFRELNAIGKSQTIKHNVCCFGRWVIPKKPPC